jgi:hypothetical protein
VFPDWQIDHQFMVDKMYSAFRRDMSGSHPIYADFVDSPDAVYGIFDSITYNKGIITLNITLKISNIKCTFYIFLKQKILYKIFIK